MTEEEGYWELVNSDSRQWTHDQKILYWWLAKCLVSLSHVGTVICPASAPLTEDQIIQVFSALLWEGSGAYLGRTWQYIDQTIITYAQDGVEVLIKSGTIRVTTANKTEASS